ncbi:hypothetical protein AB0H51_14030 [Streptomyces griseoluteus]|uniref:hypothetical protein n=1 Tax=Streptomyces griseoluteus TaxID=29306 RepID=UPI0033FBE1CC
MASQIMTLVGVLLGALTSFVAASMAERARFRRTLATRWDERKLDTYIEYISCVKEEVRSARRARAEWGRGDDNSEALQEMEAAENKRSVLFEGLLLLSDDAAAEAAHVVNQRVWDVLECTRDPESFSSDVHRERRNAAIHALNTLHKAARSDLTIASERSET